MIDRTFTDFLMAINLGAPAAIRLDGDDDLQPGVRIGSFGALHLNSNDTPRTNRFRRCDESGHP
jgi:hypothetical protein